MISVLSAAAIPPNRELHEPWKCLGKAAIEPRCVDFAGRQANDIGAATRSVAAEAIGMGGVEASQDTGSVQKIVDQAIDLAMRLERPTTFWAIPSHTMAPTDLGANGGS